jgi:antitoxin CptB
MDSLLDARELGRLRWRCRRGLLENDLFIDRYWRDHAATITTGQAQALMALMDLSDPDLLDLLLARTGPQGGLDRPEVHQVLALLRRARPAED